MSAPARSTLALLATADDALVRTVDTLSPCQLAEPTELPGWTRAHVVAHLALNAEGLARALSGRRTGRPTTMYDSQEARDADIEALAAAGPADLRDRMLAGTHSFSQAVLAMTEDHWDGAFERTPGGQPIAYVDVPLMRLREVEIHHADLGAGYSFADWPPEFSAVLLDSAVGRSALEPFRAHARDLEREWTFGDGEDLPVVVGDAAALGWWITGRGIGEGLSCSSGPLPRIDGW